MKHTENQFQKSFFASFDEKTIFHFWNDSKNLFELATKLGLKKNKHLIRMDYEYIELIKNRHNWKRINSHIKSRQRYNYILNLCEQELSFAMNLNAIETLSHLALHYLVSPKHGRKILRKRILELKLDVKDCLYWGIYGISKKPFNWPTPYYEKRIGQKPNTCSICNFKANKSKQIQLHHFDDGEWGSKKKRNSIYYTTKKLIPLCANCHSLEHRTGEHLVKLCGKWHSKLPGNQKYKNPNDLFSKQCLENYRVQKNYYLKWYLTNSIQYKCQKCGVYRWGNNNKLLTLELHHKDQNHKNSLISNLELLCPNCHAEQ
jgi:hypothetical protein